MSFGLFVLFGNFYRFRLVHEGDFQKTLHFSLIKLLNLLPQLSDHVGILQITPNFAEHLLKIGKLRENLVGFGKLLYQIPRRRVGPISMIEFFEEFFLLIVHLLKKDLTSH